MNEFGRRDFLKAGGSLVVGFPLRHALFGQGHLDPGPRKPVPGPPDPQVVDTWLAVHADSTATFYIGFAELGQGATTALLQIAAEELDLAWISSAPSGSIPASRPIKAVPTPARQPSAEARRSVQQRLRLALRSYGWLRRSCRFPPQDSWFHVE